MLLCRVSGCQSRLGSHAPAANLAWACLFHVHRAASHRGELIRNGVLLDAACVEYLDRGWVLLGHDSVTDH